MIIYLSFGFPAYNAVGWLSDYSLMWEENLASGFLYKTVKICKNHAILKIYMG